MRTLTKLFGASLLVLVGFGAFTAFGASADEVRIVTDDATHVIEAEIADTDEERRTGLMFREDMAENHGMLFDFEEPRTVTMWMENTLIPLDMLFIEEDGTILTIKRNAEPLSRATIPSGGPVRYVLELNGGAAKRLDVEPGDRVEYSAIDPGE